MVGRGPSDPFCCEPAEWGARVSQGIHPWSPQVDWISISGTIAVDRVLQMENLQESFAELRCALAGGALSQLEVAQALFILLQRINAGAGREVLRKGY